MSHPYLHPSFRPHMGTPGIFHPEDIATATERLHTAPDEDSARRALAVIYRAIGRGNPFLAADAAQIDPVLAVRAPATPDVRALRDLGASTTSAPPIPEPTIPPISVQAFGGDRLDISGTLIGMGQTVFDLAHQPPLGPTVRLAASLVVPGTLRRASPEQVDLLASGLARVLAAHPVEGLDRLRKAALHYAGLLALIALERPDLAPPVSSWPTLAQLHADLTGGPRAHMWRDVGEWLFVGPTRWLEDDTEWRMEPEVAATYAAAAAMCTGEDAWRCLRHGHTVWWRIKSSDTARQAFEDAVIRDTADGPSEFSAWAERSIWQIRTVDHIDAVSTLSGPLGSLRDDPPRVGPAEVVDVEAWEDIIDSARDETAVSRLERIVEVVPKLPPARAIVSAIRRGLRLYLASEVGDPVGRLGFANAARFVEGELRREVGPLEEVASGLLRSQPVFMGRPIDPAQAPAFQRLVFSAESVLDLQWLGHALDLTAAGRILMAASAPGVSTPRMVSLQGAWRLNGEPLPHGRWVQAAADAMPRRADIQRRGRELLAQLDLLGALTHLGRGPIASLGGATVLGSLSRLDAWAWTYVRDGMFRTDDQGRLHSATEPEDVLIRAEVDAEGRMDLQIMPIEPPAPVDSPLSGGEVMVLAWTPDGPRYGQLNGPVDAENVSVTERTRDGYTVHTILPGASLLAANSFTASGETGGAALRATRSMRKRLWEIAFKAHGTTWPDEPVPTERLDVVCAAAEEMGIGVQRYPEPVSDLHGDLRHARVYALLRFPDGSTMGLHADARRFPLDRHTPGAGGSDTRWDAWRARWDVPPPIA